MGQFEAEGDLTLHFALASASLSSPVSSETPLSPAIRTFGRTARGLRERIEGVISAHLKDPFGPGKYEAFDSARAREWYHPVA